MFSSIASGSPMIRILLVFFCLSAHLQAVAQSASFSSGEDKVHLLELYSSQGCSSCPPAQTWVNKLEKSPALWNKVVPIVFHVDYWDYLGWKDPFSQKQFSFRQRSHNREGNINSVYTPGFVVDGKEWKGWFRGKGLELPSKLAGNLTLQLENGEFVASYSPADQHEFSDPGSANFEPANLELNIALLGMNNITPVLAGENRSRELQESFIVLSLHRYSVTENTGFSHKGVVDYHGKLPGKDNAPNSKPQAIAAWITENSSLKPIQATGGYLDF